MALLCRLGVHAWYTDAGLIRSVQRCNDCGRPKSAARAAELDAERERVNALPAACSVVDMFRAAAGKKLS